MSSIIWIRKHLLNLKTIFQNQKLLFVHDSVNQKWTPNISHVQFWESAGWGFFSVVVVLCIFRNTKPNRPGFLPGQLCWEYREEIHYFPRGTGHLCHRLLHQEQNSLGLRSTEKWNSSCHYFKKRYCGQVWWDEFCFSLKAVTLSVFSANCVV